MAGRVGSEVKVAFLRKAEARPETSVDKQRLRSALFGCSWFTVFWLAIMSNLPPVAVGQQPELDIVRVRQSPKPGESGWYSDGVVEYAGSITNFDANVVELRLANGEVQRSPAGQVQAV